MFCIYFAQKCEIKHGDNMKKRTIKRTINFFLIIILCIFLEAGCTQIYNINIDGVNISCVNFSIPSDNNRLEKIITPIVKTVKNNLGNNLTISEVRMPNPLIINFKLNIKKIESEHELNLVFTEIEDIHNKINESITNNIEDYNVFDNWSIELYYNNESILKIDSSVNIKNKSFFNSLYLNNTFTLKFINNFKNNYSRLYNNTKKKLPESLNTNFSNIQDLRTYVNSNQDFSCLLNFSNIKYICLIIKNDSLDLSPLKYSTSAEHITLYLYKDIDISTFPKLNNLKDLYIHSNYIKESDIENLKGKLLNCNILLDDNMEIY